jgi:thioredoxin 1
MEAVTDASFADEVLASHEPVLVDFWAPWCRPCDAIEPHLRALAEAHGLRVVKLNVDDNLAVAGRYGVLALPTVILFAGGEPRVTVRGARSRSHYERELGSYLG